MSTAKAATVAASAGSMDSMEAEWTTIEEGSDLAAAAAADVMGSASSGIGGALSQMQQQLRALCSVLKRSHQQQATAAQGQTALLQTVLQNIPDKNDVASLRKTVQDVKDSADWVQQVQSLTLELKVHRTAFRSQEQQLLQMQSLAQMREEDVKLLETELAQAHQHFEARKAADAVMRDALQQQLQEIQAELKMQFDINKRLTQDLLESEHQRQALEVQVKVVPQLLPDALAPLPSHSSRHSGDSNSSNAAGSGNATVPVPHDEFSQLSGDDSRMLGGHSAFLIINGKQYLERAKVNLLVKKLRKGGEASRTHRDGPHSHSAQEQLPPNNSAPTATSGSGFSTTLQQITSLPHTPLAERDSNCSTLTDASAAHADTSRVDAWSASQQQALEAAVDAQHAAECRLQELMAQMSIIQQQGHESRAVLQAQHEQEQEQAQQHALLQAQLLVQLQQQLEEAQRLSTTHALAAAATVAVQGREQASEQAQARADRQDSSGLGSSSASETAVSSPSLAEGAHSAGSIGSDGSRSSSSDSSSSTDRSTAFAALNRELQLEREMHEAVLGELHQAREHLRQLQAAKTDTERELSVVRGHIQSLERDYNDALAAREEAAMEREAMASERTAVAATAARHQQQVAKLEAQLAEQQALVVELQAAVAAAEAIASAAQANAAAAHAAATAEAAAVARTDRSGAAMLCASQQADDLEQAACPAIDGKEEVHQDGPSAVLSASAGAVQEGIGAISLPEQSLRQELLASHAEREALQFELEEVRLKLSALLSAAETQALKQLATVQREGGDDTAVQSDAVAHATQSNNSANSKVHSLHALLGAVRTTGLYHTKAERGASLSRIRMMQAQMEHVLLSALDTTQKCGAHKGHSVAQRPMEDSRVEHFPQTSAARHLGGDPAAAYFDAHGAPLHPVDANHPYHMPPSNGQAQHDVSAQAAHQPAAHAAPPSAMPAQLSSFDEGLPDYSLPTPSLPPFFDTAYGYEVETRHGHDRDTPAAALPALQDDPMNGLESAWWDLPAAEPPPSFDLDFDFSSQGP